VLPPPCVKLSDKPVEVYTEPDGSCVVMSDLSASEQSMRRWPLLSPCAPALHFASLIGKFGPWKEAIGKLWASVFDLESTKSACPSRWSSRSLLSSVSLRSLQLVEAPTKWAHRHNIVGHGHVAEVSPPPCPLHDGADRAGESDSCRVDGFCRWDRQSI
jgi:hypothetical protein